MQPAAVLAELAQRTSLRTTPKRCSVSLRAVRYQGRRLMPNLGTLIASSLMHRVQLVPRRLRPVIDHWAGRLARCHGQELSVEQGKNFLTTTLKRQNSLTRFAEIVLLQTSSLSRPSLVRTAYTPYFIGP
jgi:hypothetical protein